jgi:Cation transporter/ATPase, N-terminus
LLAPLRSLSSSVIVGRHQAVGSKVMMKVFLLSLALAVQLPWIRAEFGDYRDPTFNCPAVTTCRQACVAKADDCPFESLCPDGATLCADGSCGDCTDDMESPCAYECAPVACHRIVRDFDECQNIYGAVYKAETKCGELEEESYPKHKFNEPMFLLAYIWIITVTLAIILWCAFNQRFSPVEGSTQALAMDSADKTAWQTGYRVHPVGLAIYIMTVLTFIGIQALLFFLTIDYYIIVEKVTRLGEAKFQDEEQGLKVFIITWMVSFIWCFTLKWPYSVHSLLLRRCTLDKATHVAVSVFVNTKETEEVFDDTYLKSVRLFFSTFFSLVNSFLRQLFSEVDPCGRSSKPNSVYHIIKVRHDGNNIPYYLFMFRRYNLSGNVFTPGKLTVGNTIGDLAKATSRSGLTAEEVRQRQFVVGYNMIEIKKPTPLGAIINEFTKPFYTYQNFMIWSW